MIGEQVPPEIFFVALFAFVRSKEERYLNGIHREINWLGSENRRGKLNLLIVQMSPLVVALVSNGCKSFLTILAFKGFLPLMCAHVDPQVTFFGKCSVALRTGKLLPGDAAVERLHVNPQPVLTSESLATTLTFMKSKSL